MEKYGMVSFNGYTKAGAFYDQIRSRRKTRTLRERRDDGRPHVKPGYAFSMYWEVRKKKADKPIHYIGMAMCIAYEPVKIIDHWNDEEFAKSDGFEDLEEFRDNWYPEWREMPWLDDIIEAYHSLKKQDVDMKPFFVWGNRQQGKATTIKFLQLEYMMIHFRYLEPCGITVCSHNTARARDHGHNLCLKEGPTGGCLKYTL